MNLAIAVYLISMFSEIRGFAVFIVVMLCIAFFFVGLFAFLEGRESEEFDFFKSKIRFFCLTFSICAGVIVFIPSEKTAYAMMAAYGAQSIAENPQVQDLAENSLKVLDKVMKDYLEESDSE